MASPSKKSPRRRLDVAVVSAGLASSREKAQALILAGRIFVDGARRDKPGQQIPASANLELSPGKRPYASRGGEKLAGVLEDLGVDPSGWRCLDVGASTGGFTDVLLRRGACHVTAVDVGRGLLDQKVRDDPRVRLVEGLNARHMGPEDVDPPYDLATLDLSFISLTLVLPAVMPLCPEGRILAMVKPQFEVGRRQVGPKGVVRDPELRFEAVAGIARFLSGREWGILGVRASPIAGPKGNREVFVLAARGGGLSEDAYWARIREEVERDEG